MAFLYIFGLENPGKPGGCMVQCSKITLLLA